jgi:hypothetical protein
MHYPEAGQWVLGLQLHKDVSLTHYKNRQKLKPYVYKCIFSSQIKVDK